MRRGDAARADALDLIRCYWPSVVAHSNQLCLPAPMRQTTTRSKRQIAFSKTRKKLNLRVSSLFGGVVKLKISKKKKKKKSSTFYSISICLTIGIGFNVSPQMSEKTAIVEVKFAHLLRPIR